MIGFLNAVLGFLRLSLPSHPDVEVRAVPCHKPLQLSWLFCYYGFLFVCFLFCVLNDDGDNS